MEQRSKIIRMVCQVSFVGLLCLFVFAADRAVIGWLTGYYQQQEDLIYAVAGSGADSVENAQYLRSKPSKEDVEKGRKELAVLGYDEEVATIQKSELKRHKLQIYICSILGLALFFALIWGVSHIYVSAYKKRLNNISHVLSRIHDEKGHKDGSIHQKAGLLGAWQEEEILQEKMESLKEQTQLLHERMEQEKEGTKRLVTDISHQMKTPVAALKNSLELLQEEDLTMQERQEFLARVSGQMESLSRLVKSMVNISRLEKGMIKIQKKPADLMKTIRDSVSRVWEKAENKEIFIEFENGDEINECSLSHDPYWTVEALSNLFDNAVKYSPARSAIRIRLIFLTMYVKIEVEDEGIGVAKEDYHRIFQRFYRGPDTEDIEGSGVGLYLAREILERQGGGVFIRSKKHGAGSIFVMQLPLS